MAHGERVRIKARISRINGFGLCEVVRVEEAGRAAFTLDKVIGYGGQPLREFGIEEGAEVELIEDETGRIESARLVDAAAAA